MIESMDADIAIQVEDEDQIYDIFHELLEKPEVNAVATDDVKVDS